MKSSIALYFKYQASYLLLLQLIFTLPLGLFLKFSTYEAPNIQYIVLGVLIVSQYAFFNEANYKKKIEDDVVLDLKKEINQIPSKSQIVLRLNRITRLRGVSIVITAISILILMIYLQKF